MKGRPFWMGMVVALWDIDGLKYVNNHFGHNEGDELIVTACSSFKGAIRECDIICRLDFF